MLEGETVLSGAEHPGTALEVMESGAGRFYLGFPDEHGAPYTRESVYFATKEHAESALAMMRGTGQ
jgi:hypothetical protein